MILNQNPTFRLKDGTVISRSSRKQASIGGDADQGFEQSFASLAFAHIQDKAPGLLDYMIGFQLVDRNDDKSKAAGVFGFKVGPRWLYAPVFFLNGDLKGHELLYLKDQDTFVPMKENWINYIINKKPNILGEGVSGTQDQLGVMQPSFNALTQVPESSKFSSHMKQWAKTANVLPNIARLVTQNPMAKYPGLSEKFDLGELISASPQLAKLAFDMTQAYPFVKQAFNDFYGPTFLSSAVRKLREAHADRGVLSKRPVAPVKVASGILKQSAADNPPKIEVLTDALITENRRPNNEEEAKKLLQQGYLVRDHRTGDEVSVVYNTQVEMSLANPDTTGVYQLLTRPDGFAECLIVYQPYCGWGRKNFCTVVRLDNDGDQKAVENLHQSRLFVRQDGQTAKSDKSEMADWLSSQSDQTTLEVGASYVILGPSGADGTCSFEVREELGDGNYEVSWDDYGSNTGPESLDWGPSRLSNPQPVPVECTTVCFNQRAGSGFRLVGGKLYLPAACRVVKVKDAPRCRTCRKSEPECTCDYFRRDYRDRPGAIEPGSLADIQLRLLAKQASAAPGAGLSELKVWTDHHEVVINRKRLSKMAGLFHLICDHGLREGVARKLIKEAERSGGSKRWYIKYAMPYMGELGPYAAGEGGYSLPTDNYMGGAVDPAYGNIQSQFYDGGSEQVVPELSAGNTDPSIYDPMQNIDPHAQQVAQQAYQTNQKEVFDVAMLANMLKAVRQDSIVDRYIGDLLKAVDRIGRILLMFYWHNEEFMDQYGKQDLPELEDTLRNAFEVVSDLYLFLKQKTVEPAAFSETDISNAARN